ncbi:hypothetical protein GQ457_12G013380 [Hibiscus cannabinus]
MSTGSREQKKGSKILSTFSSFSLMGNGTDNWFLAFIRSDEGFGFQQIESRSRPPLGRRMVRLEQPSPGDRNPNRYRQVWNETPSDEVRGGCYVCSCFPFVLQDSASWMELSDRYKVWLGFSSRQYGCWRNRLFTLVWKKNGSDGSAFLRKESVLITGGLLKGILEFRESKVTLRSGGKNTEMALTKGSHRLIWKVADWKMRERMVEIDEQGTLKEEESRANGKYRDGFLSWRCDRWRPEMVGSKPRKYRGKFSGKKMITCEEREKIDSREGAELYEGTWKGCHRQGHILGKGGTFSGYVIQPRQVGRNEINTRGAHKRRLETLNHAKMMTPVISAVYLKIVAPCREAKWVLTNGAQVLVRIYFNGRFYTGAHWVLINEISDNFTLIMHGLHVFTPLYCWVPVNKLSRREDFDTNYSGPGYQSFATIDLGSRKHEWLRLKRRIKRFILCSKKVAATERGGGEYPVSGKASYSIMADEVAGLMGNLNFSEEELADVNSSGEEMMETMEGTEKWVVGKLISPSIVDSGLLIRVFFAVWKETPLEEASPLGPNLFLFKFKQEEFRDSVLNRCPWSFDGELLALKPFDGLLSPSEYNFHPLHIWLRVYQVPLGLMTQQMGEKIGNTMGVHKAVDLRDGEGRMGEYLRLRSEIDSSRPLRRFITLGKLADGNPRMCPIKYERLPKFCYHCGRIGHGWELCVDRPVEFQGPFQFGDWLKVDLGKERQHARRKLGIVYADRKSEREGKEGSGDHLIESQTEEGRSLQLKGKGKLVGTSTKMRAVKRTLKGKNEVCNPIASKKSRTTNNNLIGDRMRSQRPPLL